MLYLIIISSVVAVSLSSAICVSCLDGTISLTYAIVAPLLVLLYVFLVLGVLNLILRFCLPKSCWDYKRKYFTVSKKEVKFYEKLKIRNWKDKVPEWGKTAGFSKSRLQSLDAEYLQKFIYETCIGEILHLLGAIFGFTCLFFFPVAHYYFVLPIVFTSFVLNLMPCIIQRYNRARLLVVYKFKTRHSVVKMNEEDTATSTIIEESL